MEATITLIDTAKTFAPENDRVVARAVKRMEKRLFILQVRAARTRKRNRIKAFWDAMAAFNGGADMTGRRAVIPCRGCQYRIHFGDFCRAADFTGAGRIKTLTCPNCHRVMEAP